MTGDIFALVVCLVLHLVYCDPSDTGCIRIKECPSALKHIRQINNNKNSLEILHSAHCGFTGMEPMVKCSAIQEPQKDWKDVTTSKCVQLQDCPAALKLIETGVFDPQVVNMFRSMHCGSDKLQPMVYCNHLNTDV